ncbi:2-amino-3-carboxymuconate-6-semialdehyde decarboxylase [Nonlabens ulvanivorans]|nr:2-amino-3-carboxymuconate-6-semialdehyde decarboxylase [Nonlabens ulvanivorans]
MGLDDPYPLGEMDSEKQSSYPGKILDLAMDRDIITQDDYDGMWDEHVVRWLFGDNDAAKKEFYDRVTGK